MNNKSTSRDNMERINYGKTQFVEILEHLQSNKNVDIKVIRIAKKLINTRPVRIVLPDSKVVNSIWRRENEAK